MRVYLLGRVPCLPDMVYGKKWEQTGELIYALCGTLLCPSFQKLEHNEEDMCLNAEWQMVIGVIFSLSFMKKFMQQKYTKGLACSQPIL